MDTEQTLPQRSAPSAPLLLPTPALAAPPTSRGYIRLVEYVDEGAPAKYRKGDSVRLPDGRAAHITRTYRSEVPDDYYSDRARVRLTHLALPMEMEVEDAVRLLAEQARRTGRVIVEGRIYRLREAVKAMGGWWHPEARCWTVPAERAEDVAVLVAAEAAGKDAPRMRCAHCGNSFTRAQVEQGGGSWEDGRCGWC